MPASICSTFHIVVDETLGTGGTPNALLDNPGRPFSVTSVLVTGAASAELDVANNDTGLVCANSVLAAGDLNDFPSTMTLANNEFTATQDILCVSQNANNITRIVIICEAITPQALTVVTAA